MAENKLTMFGKTYNTVGSADTNLILLTKGDLKVRWGNKFIDLIKNGKINVDVDVLKRVNSKEEIYKDGIYLIRGENGDEMWIQVNGELVNIQGEIGTTYVSFAAPQKVTSNQQILALENIGFYYDTFANAAAANIEYGLIYCKEVGKLYIANKGELTLYNNEVSIPNPLLIGSITIDGSKNRIYSKTDLNIGINTNNYITMTTSKISFLYDSLFSGRLQSNDFDSGSSGRGFGIYNEDDVSILEIDKVIIRKNLTIIDYEEVTYSLLYNAINSSSLIEGRKYIIKDFLNEWEITLESQIYAIDERGELNNDRYQGHCLNVWPIVLVAKNSNTLESTGYFKDHPEWVIEYDPNFYGLVKTENKVDSNGNIILQDGNPIQVKLFSKGRITKLTDEKNNTANYDFKHKTFRVFSSIQDPLKQDEEYAYTFNTTNDLWWRLPANNDENYLYYSEPYVYEAYHQYADASQIDENCVNNTIYIDPPTLEDIEGEDIKEVKQSESFIVINTPTYGNNIECIGEYLVNGVFYNNKVKFIQNIDERTLYTFEDTVTFINNNINNFYAKGDINDNASTSIYINPSETILSNVSANTMYNCTFNGCNLSNVKFADSVYANVFHSCTLLSVEFLDTVHDNLFNENSIILDSLFKLEVLDFKLNGEITHSIFLEINDATIQSEAIISNSSFNNLSDDILLGSLSYVKVYDSLTPSSAVMREDENDINVLVPIESLVLDTTTIPRLGGLGTKECHIVNKEYGGVTYRTFVVSLSSEDTTPSGIIAMYSGLVSNIPAGWVICDGNNGTPDLRGRFIRMVDRTTTTGSDNNTYTVYENCGPVNNTDLDNGDPISIPQTVLNPGTSDEVTLDSAEIIRRNKLTKVITHTHNFVVDQLATADTKMVVGYNVPENPGNTVEGINVEPQAYALIFIMKL